MLQPNFILKTTLADRLKKIHTLLYVKVPLLYSQILEHSSLLFTLVSLTGAGLEDEPAVTCSRGPTGFTCSWGCVCACVCLCVCVCLCICVCVCVCGRGTCNTTSTPSTYRPALPPEIGGGTPLLLEEHITIIIGINP